MLDCYMALDVQYTVELAKRFLLLLLLLASAEYWGSSSEDWTCLSRRLEPYDIKWIEEPLMPDEYEVL